MLDSILSSVSTTVSLSLPQLLLCTAASLAMGLGIALVYMYKNTYSKNFVVTLALLPAMVQIVILLVNGNLGTGVAVVGAFSLVRFRSVPGSAREISAILFAMLLFGGETLKDFAFAMAIGLATGMGYVGVALLFLILVGLMTLLLTRLRFGESRAQEKELRITIPESLDYSGIFDDLFAKYTKRAELVRVKTSGMGSLYELHYRVALREPVIEKAFLDDLRCRNGNLTISCGPVSTVRDEL